MALTCRKLNETDDYVDYAVKVWDNYCTGGIVRVFLKEPFRYEMLKPIWDAQPNHSYKYLEHVASKILSEYMRLKFNDDVIGMHL
jgi:hypothetical protein